ncbi:amidohydrolase family protein [Rubricoccus marinus]|uniref:amidohydrolase family protein n=1 Tax=Rubricoccus marinus TaxID=716817 RepID=UPI001C527B67|nr:amidohydrolase family protein [Rubricoccus marinus]
MRALLVAFLLTLASGAHSQTAFVGAKVIPIAGPEIADGVVVVQDGRITAVGARGSVRVPSGATVVDVSGKVLMPGIVDTHSHVGDGDGGDSSAPMHPDVRILDALDPRADSFERARAGGITTVNVMPGSGHLMSGQTAYLKLRDANVIEDMLLCDDPLTDICGGMKMANGTNSLRGRNGFPDTRARAVAIVREAFLEAEAFRQKRAAGDSVGRNLRLEGLAEVLEGTRTVHFHTHRHDDVLTALRIGREFGFTPVLHHVSEGWRVADEIAAAGAPASIIVLDSPGGKMEARGLYFRTGRVMEDAGVDVAYHTDDGITDSRLFLRSAALGVRAGMSREKALEAMTLAGARMLGIADEVGSLEAGKSADLIVLSGDPLSIYTRIEQTWVDGTKVFDLAIPEDAAYSVGGYDVYRAFSQHDHE